VTRTVAGVLAFGGVALAAQQATFRSAVHYVAVDVVVTDRSDKPILDLKREDFEIVERGKVQSITDFQFVSIPAAARTLTAASPAPPEPDVVTNARPSEKSRLFVLVIDDLHILESNIVPVKKVMTDFLTALSPDDEVAVVFTRRSDISINFTTSFSRMMKTVDRVRDALGFGLDAMGQDGTRRVDPRARASIERSVAISLKNVVRSLAGSGHSRRAIVLVTDGLGYEFMREDLPDLVLRTVRDDYVEFFGLAKRVGVPVYTIDPRGLALPEDSVRGGIDAIRSAAQRGAIAQAIEFQHDYMATVALTTGGRAFFNSADLARAVTEIVQENGSYYLLGYYPEPFASDGKFHDVR